MHNLDDLRQFGHYLLLSPAFQQIFPLIVVLVIPLFVLTVNAHRGPVISIISMVLETLALVLPWNWFDSNPSTSSTPERKSRKKHVRTRADQLAREGDIHELTEVGMHNEGYYPGLVNISGTYCFMNSTLQAMASLCFLQPHLEEIHTKAVALDVPTPVVDALRDLLHTLNTPTSSRHAQRPIQIIDALSNHSPGKHTSLFASREHQDAQELFQLLTECIKSEAAAVEKEGHRDRGLGALAQMPGPASRGIGKSVFDGLTANRRSCIECGYTEAVMHFAFDNWQLAVPRVAACRLEDCLKDYTRLEILTDCICRKCSMLATYQRLAHEAEKLTESSQADREPSSSKKRRAREARKVMARVQAALDEGRIEEDIKGVKMEKVYSKASTKQAMVARPPRVLALHLNRSLHYGHYAAKNTCRVVFSEILDLTPYTTSGQLSTTPSVPISTPPPPIPRSTTPTPATFATPRTFYRLAAVVCHYGEHSFGHYVCYRRKPRPPSTGARRFTPPKMSCPLGCECERCEKYGPVRDDDETPRLGCGWLRISDDSVRECGIEAVLQEGSGAFMLYYERVSVPRPSVYMSRSPRSSEETVRPEVQHANGSSASLTSIDEEASEVKVVKPIPKIIGPRIVRSVSTHRVRGLSVSPSERESSLSPALSILPSKQSGKSLPNGHAKPFVQDHVPLEVNGVLDPASASAGTDLAASTSTACPHVTAATHTIPNSTSYISS
ncbi:hypothetical protein AcV7_002875 [Taiwanofungus camphoratus]|nr:hypothetical protein AcV7_002875 [Antrodia cinnamomea]